MLVVTRLKIWFFNSIELNGVYYGLYLLYLFSYLNFSVTIAITTHRIVTIQKRTAILLS